MSGEIPVILGDAVDGALKIHCTSDELRIPQLGLTCQPAPVTPIAVEAITELLNDADDAPTALLLDADEPYPQPDSEAPAPVDIGSDDPPYDLLVRVLGHITVEGTTERLTRKQTALVT